ncbi:MAG: hypothetical protein JOS17DRAFT_814371 [Linnemannia elongata]|nr:MAG: hypothetical protein JOS17DRAFT_814371 [Linnemannia elongata]
MLVVMHCRLLRVRLSHQYRPQTNNYLPEPPATASIASNFSVAIISGSSLYSKQRATLPSSPSNIAFSISLSTTNRASFPPPPATVSPPLFLIHYQQQHNNIYRAAASFNYRLQHKHKYQQEQLQLKRNAQTAAVMKMNLHQKPIVNLAVHAMLGTSGLNDQPPKNDNLYPDNNEDEEAVQPKVGKLTTQKKLRMGITNIRSSPQRIKKFVRICDIVKCSKLALIKDVSMQWNSTFAMLDRAIDINDANQSMCQNEPTLAAYTLEEDECLSGKAPRFALPVCHYGKDRIASGLLPENGFHTSIYSGNSNGSKDAARLWGANGTDEYIQISKAMITDNWNNHHKGKVGPIDLDADTERQLKLYGIEMKAGEQGKFWTGDTWK